MRYPAHTHASKLLRPSPSALIRPARRLCFAVGLLLCASAATPAKPDFSVQPPPAWVQAVAPDAAPTSPAPTSLEDSVRYLLLDRQIHVTQQGVERYQHLVKQIASVADLEKVSQLRLDFEPSYQQLVIHYIHILRDGATIDVLRPEEIKVIQQEDELDEQLFNGTNSAVVFLNDLRAGDVVDYAYSVNGQNPVLAGHYVDIQPLSRPEPVARLRTRLLWPTERKLYFRAQHTDAQPAINQAGAETEYVWERRNVAADEAEDMTPPWFNATASVQLSEFATWSDVVQWALPLYRVENQLSPALAAQVEKWKAELPQPEARLLAARRFVQDEVRYLGIELGPYSHTPTQPDKVFQRRFGDCKDKSLLFATMLNALGIEAYPALVNTDARHTLDNYQPSPYAFDHVIVQAQLAGQTYWLDPTIAYQRGTLANAYAPEYERALVLRPETQALTTIPLNASAQPTVTVQQVYQIAHYDAPVALTVTTTLRGADADEARYRLAGESRADLSKNYLNYYAEHDPSIEADGKPEVRDDEQANVIVITERYRIPNFWKDAAHVFLADRVGEELTKPDVSRRTQPLRIHYPLNVEQLIEIHLPYRQAVETGAETVEDAALRFTSNAVAEGNVIRLHYTLRTKAAEVAPQNVASHLATIEQARDLAGYELKQGRPQTSQPFGHALDALFAVALGGVGLLLLYGWLKRRRVAARALAQAASLSLRARPGTRPETAIKLEAETEIARYLNGVACRSCGRRDYAQAGRQGLIYDGRRLVVVQLECATCRNSQDLYFALAV